MLLVSQPGLSDASEKLLDPTPRNEPPTQARSLTLCTAILTALATAALACGPALIHHATAYQHQAMSAVDATIAITAAPVAQHAALPAFTAAPIPRAKLIFQQFDILFHHQGDSAGMAWTDKPGWLQAMGRFFAFDFTYDFVHPYGITHGVSEWFECAARH